MLKKMTSQNAPESTISQLREVMRPPKSTRYSTLKGFSTGSADVERFLQNRYTPPIGSVGIKPILRHLKCPGFGQGLRQGEILILMGRKFANRIFKIRLSLQQ
jgi:hypothetical protein